MITKIILSCIAVVVGWAAVLASVMILSDAAPAALVLLPDAAFITDLPPGVAILSQNALSVTVTGDAPSLGLTLYRAGAWLVLPAGLLGCAPLTS